MKSLAQEGWILKPDVNKSHSELLNTDLSHVGAKIIPADFANATSLAGPKILQFKRVKDVSHSKISHENGSNKSMFRITLSDGNSTCSAMNLQVIPGLSGKVYPGTKLRIKSGGAQVLGGFLLLTPANCEILGGRVEKLVENIEKNENISKKKSNDSGPPKYVPFGSSANNATTNHHISLEKPSRERTDTVDENVAGSSQTPDFGRTSRNDGKKFDRDQKSGHQKDRGNKFQGKRGQSTRNSDDQRGQHFNTDTRGNDERGRSKNRGNSKPNFRSSSGNRGNSNHEDRPNRFDNRDRDEDGSRDSGRSRGRGRGSRGKDRSRRDDYSPPERSHPSGFSLGDLVQDFPALGSPAPAASAGRGEDDTHNSSDRFNSRSSGGSREYEDRGRSSDRSRGRGRGSRGRGNSRSRRDDYPSGQSKPAGYKADLEADFPALGGGTTAESSNAPTSNKAKPSTSKSKPHALVDDEGFEIHDHLLYDDNGPPRQLHDPSFHHKQGYDNYRSGPDPIVDRMRDMNLSGHNSHDRGQGRNNRGGGGSAKNQDNRGRNYGNGNDQRSRRGGDDSYQGRRDYDGYEQRYNDRYEQRYDDRYEQRYNDRYEQRYDDRYEQRYNDRNEQRNDYHRNDRPTSSNRSNLSGKRGRSSGNRRY